MPDSQWSGLESLLEKEIRLCILPSLSYKCYVAVLPRVILLARFCELLTTVAILSAGEGTMHMVEWLFVE